MNKTIISLIRMVVLSICFLSTLLHASETLEFNLPDNVSLKFKPIYLGLDGNQVFTSKRVKMGSRQGEDVSYKERLSTTNLGGSFVGTNNQGRKDWFYYLGQTEVSRQQWNTVMRWWQAKNGLKVEAVDNSKLPVTGKTPAEIFTFIEALNIWVLKNTKKDLPKNGNALAYFRLPTEVEWAFAARGGIEVPEDVFDRPYPYTDGNGHMMLGGFEWFRSSSGKKVKEVGSQHIQASPLGLYDMLGNVEELTYGIFGHDFLFARYGGLVIRGGNFSTDQRDMRVSMRTEFDGYTASGDAIRLSKVGFRLALGTLVSEMGHSNEELDDGYDEYLSSEGGVSQPAPAGKTSLSQQAEDDQINWYREERERLIQEVDSLQLKNKDLQSNYESLKGNVNQKKIAIVDIQSKLDSEIAKNLELTKLISINVSDNNSDSYLKAKDIEISRLQSEIERLQNTIQQQTPKIAIAEESNRKLISLQQKLEDAKRRDVSAGFEIDKNKQRLVVSEKRLLEALTRVAGYNLYVALRNLKTIELKSEKFPPDSAAFSKVTKVNKDEAERAIMEYRRYIIQIVDNTDPDLFPEVKSELVQWMKGNNVALDQIKGLDLLDRHVGEVRRGEYIKVTHLYDNLLQEPEIR